MKAKVLLKRLPVESIRMLNFSDNRFVALIVHEQNLDDAALLHIRHLSYSFLNSLLNIK